MAQYQSFPGASGDSRTLDKLKVLNMPQLSGQSFLDVGCNEGFFCGYAKYQGAVRAVGIDQSAPFLKRARSRFPECEFHERSWDDLPDGEFDTILLASALHYAEDQEALIHRLVERLSADGVLVLELGIVSSTKSDWVPVKRGIDERIFPTMGKLREILGLYAWKWMGPSIQQAGDPVMRHVIHVRRRRPVVYLLMEPPGYGKSTIAASLFGSDSVRVISGDAALALISRDEVPASVELAQLVKADFSPFTIDRLIANIFSAGFAEQLVRVWCELAGPGDFALDAFVPAEHHPAVQKALDARGYLPVKLSWDRVGTAPATAASMSEQAEEFYFSLSAAPEPSAKGQMGLPGTTTGFVDEMTLNEGRLTVSGWAVAPSGFMPPILALRIGTTIHIFDSYQKRQRPDVQRHFGLAHDLLGFVIAVQMPPDAEAAIKRGIEVMGGDHPDALTRPFPIAIAG